MGASAAVLVIGGGVVGCAVAWELARRGVAVEVIERHRPGLHATRAAAGMLSPLAETRHASTFLTLALDSFASYPAYVARLRELTGVDCGHVASGKLLVALDDESAEELEAELDWRREAELPVERLGAEEARRLEPALSRETRLALRLVDDHHIENRRLGKALWLAAAAAGVRFRLGAQATAIVRARGGGAVCGVRLATGEMVPATRVVVAAGCWSGQLAGLPRPLPVSPVRGQMVALRPVPPVIRHMVQTAGCYAIQRADGRLLLGATMERAGFACEVTAGGVGALLAAGLRALPALADAAVVETWAGLRPGTPDDAPILGEDPELPGLFYATGHHRNGILLAPVTGRVIADLVTGQPARPSIDAFTVHRFRATSVS